MLMRPRHPAQHPAGHLAEGRMKDQARHFFEDLRALAGAMQATGPEAEALDFHDAMAAAAAICLAVKTQGKKLLFIGNGASAAIASHMATDFWKTGGIRAMAFNDIAGLTCIGNDCGYARVFEKPVAMFADPGDVLFAISSSGQSENILLAADAAQRAGCDVVTLSGFSPDNPLRRMGRLNFYVPMEAYGPVEVLHHGICHCILDITA